MAIELVFETHSTTVDNEEGRATGWWPGQLSARGRTQAQQLGSRRVSDRITDGEFAAEVGAELPPN